MNGWRNLPNWQEFDIAFSSDQTIFSLNSLVGGRDEVFPMDCAKQFDWELLLQKRTVEEALSLRAVERVSALALDGLTKRLPSSLNFDQIKVLE